MRKGFTLVELLVVISIIGVLSSIVLTSLSSAREEAGIARTQIEMRQISMVILEAMMEQGNGNMADAGYGFLPSCNGVETFSSDAGCINTWEIVAGVISSYANLTLNPILDPWGGAYVINDDNGCGEVISFGRDRRGDVGFTADNIAYPIEGCSNPNP